MSELSGIRPSDIPYTLVPVSKDFVARPDRLVRKKVERFRAVAAEWIKDRYEAYEGERDRFQWKEHWYDAPVDLLQKTFSQEELYRLWYGSVILSKLGRHIEEKDPFLWKVQHCQRMYGWTTDYNNLIAGLEGLKKIDFGVTGFEVRLTHTRSLNTEARSEHDRSVYLDAAMGVFVYYKGKHVLTVGFALAHHAVYVAQVQLKQKRGNRFIYALPKHYLDLSLDMLRRAFGDCLWLAEGVSVTNAIRRSYGNKPCGMTSEDAMRIEAFYNRPLERFTRLTETKECERRKYVRLADREASAAA